MSPPLRARVFIVDDDASVRDALAWLLRTRRLVSDSYDSAEAFAPVTEFTRNLVVSSAVLALVPLQLFGQHDGIFPIQLPLLQLCPCQGNHQHQQCHFRQFHACLPTACFSPDNCGKAHDFRKFVNCWLMT